MDYGKLLQRAWTIVSGNPYLLLLGVLVALTTSGGSSPNFNYSFSSNEMDQYFGSSGLGRFEPWMGFAVAAVAGLICLSLLVFLVLWLLQQVARGGLIAGVDTIEQQQTASLSQAWRVGWSRKWTLVGIGLVILIPAIILIAIGVSSALLFFGAALASGDWLSPAVLFGGGMLGFLGTLCILVPVGFFLGLLAEFAYRAAMLEGTGVWESYVRGWHVLFDNIGPVLVFVLIRVGVGIVLLAPMFVAGLCCLLWPILLIVQGAVTTYFSAVWTLAWREFTAGPPSELPEPAIEAA
ncbi:MAG: hypothetical protein ACK2UO_04460 [Caldilineaceae bacterium]